mmetsp:Transcript_125199/g.267246  ORF Transcript_125199/g.267246 Transcript_125199/m.267246 type:complete len:277 (+) Transcript_125199:66-896(+)
MSRAQHKAPEELARHTYSHAHVEDAWANSFFRGLALDKDLHFGSVLSQLCHLLCHLAQGFHLGSIKFLHHLRDLAIGIRVCRFHLQDVMSTGDLLARLVHQLLVPDLRHADDIVALRGEARTVDLRVLETHPHRADHIHDLAKGTGHLRAWDLRIHDHLEGWREAAGELLAELREHLLVHLAHPQLGLRLASLLAHTYDVRLARRLNLRHIEFLHPGGDLAIGVGHRLHHLVLQGGAGHLSPRRIGQVLLVDLRHLDGAIALGDETLVLDVRVLEA